MFARSYRVLNMEWPVSVGKIGYSDRIMTISITPSDVGKYFGVKTKIMKFIGHGSVWRTYPEHERPGPTWSLWLSDLEAKYDHFNRSVL